MRKTQIFIILFIITFISNVIFPNFSLADTTGTVKAVKHKYVCMITNKLFVNEQIEVDIEGKKYYGCCEMCKAKLAGDIKSRYAIDPVSGKKVDKALSVTGANSTGDVYYFESENNLKVFNKNIYQ